MPKTPIDYSKIIMYRIVCNDLTVTDLYIGSTTDFRKRKNTHKSHCNNVDSRDYNLKVYTIIRANGGWCNWTMIEIEKYTTCLDGNEARARERYWIELLNASMNIQVPGRNDKEYYQNNKEKIKEYYQNNKEKIKEYNEANKDKIALRNKEYNKQYRENNKDKIKTYQKELRKLKKQSLINNV